jgi:hypothetical protein
VPPLVGDSRWSSLHRSSSASSRFCYVEAALYKTRISWGRQLTRSVDRGGQVVLLSNGHSPPGRHHSDPVTATFVYRILLRPNAEEAGYRRAHKEAESKSPS